MKLKKRLINIGHAFTRVELLAVLGVLALLAAVTWPALASPRAHSQRAECVNNLRLIGRALLIWGSDHEDQTPWQLSPPDGTRNDVRGGNVWYHFSYLSNQLVSPRILACPADPRSYKKVASDWGLLPGGFRNLAYRDYAVSYFLNMHTSVNLPLAPVAGDYNLVVAMKVSCSVVSAGAYSVSTNTAWTNSVHGLTGNLLLTDGQVLMSSSAGLRAAVAQRASLPVQLEQTHVLTPN